MKKLLLALATVSFSGCSSYQLLSVEKDVWVVRGGNLNEVFYCRGNPTEDGSATPTCIEATWGGTPWRRWRRTEPAPAPVLPTQKEIKPPKRIELPGEK